MTNIIEQFRSILLPAAAAAAIVNTNCDNRKATCGQWRREGEGSEGEHVPGRHCAGAAFAAAKIWNCEIWPLLQDELAFALQNGFGGHLHYVITLQPT